MIERKKFTHEIGGKTLTIETSEIAGQANASVIATYGETSVLATAVMGSKDVSLDYLPLKVDYEERFYAAGKIIGSRFIRREGRPSDDAILCGRLIDRTIRPLFDGRMRRDIQVVTTVLSYDGENEPDFVAMFAASAALTISDIPFAGPVGGVRIGKIGSEFVVNPTRSAFTSSECTFEVYASGPKGLINMIELEGFEAAEQDIVSAFAIALKENDGLIEFQNSLAREIGQPKAQVALAEIGEEGKKVAAEYLTRELLEEAIYHKDKKTQYAKLSALKEGFFAHVAELYKDAEGGSPSEKALEHIFEDAVDAMIHKNIIEKDMRPDLRAITEVRELKGEVAVVPRVHGSALFLRGTTQALAVTTLGAPGAAQIVETMETDEKKRFLLHYNFPPYSVGETGRIGSPGRREIGHGTLARKAVEPLLPSQEEFPYTIRVVSEILSSNGSSSMATVCASVLSLMDAGVPLKKPAAGIAMGLMTDATGKFKVLTDLQGVEDHYGDMDFKVAGTTDGVNAVQLDTKIAGLTMEMIETTIRQAHEARIKILSFMNEVIAAPRSSISPYAPMIVQITINPEKIGLVIGPGGKTINGMIEKYGLESIDIEDDGRVAVTGTKQDAVNAAVAEIRGMTREFTVGEFVEGNVIKLLDFGAIVDLGGGRDGMIHVSELKSGFVKSVADVLKVGDFVRAKIVRVEDGRIGLSLKQTQ